jgi:hypothetical protein
MASHEDNHGQTPAAWVAVGLIILGSTVSSVAVLLARPIFFWVGIAIVAIGGIVGAILHSAGLGQEASTRHIGGR